MEDKREAAIFSCLQHIVQRVCRHINSRASTDTRVFTRKWSEELAEGVPAALCGFPLVFLMKNEMLCSPIKNDSLIELPLKPEAPGTCV